MWLYIQYVHQCKRCYVVLNLVVSRFFTGPFSVASVTGPEHFTCFYFLSFNKRFWMLKKKCCKVLHKLYKSCIMIIYNNNNSSLLCVSKAYSRLNQGVHMIDWNNLHNMGEGHSVVQHSTQEVTRSLVFLQGQRVFSALIKQIKQNLFIINTYQYIRVKGSK